MAERLPRRLLVLMALACGVGVANAYFPQAITPLLARDLGVSESAATAAATVATAGYAVGIFLLVPLGDRLPRRPLISGLFVVVALGLLLAGLSSSVNPLYLFGFVVGVVTVVPQILIPMAADLAEGPHQASTVGVLQGGLVTGVLLARTFGGVVGQWFGWRAPYLVASAIALVLAVALAVSLPNTKSVTSHSYPALIKTSFTLFRTQPDLRRSCYYQFALFGGFTASWTSLALLITGPDYGYGTGVVGVIALVGAGSVLGVPYAGRWIDRVGPDRVSGLCFAGIGVASVVLLGGLAGHVTGVLLLIAGLLVLDVSVQSSQVANQARIFGLVPGARSRLNSVYMTAVFLGGSLGTWLGTQAYLKIGWAAVCALVLVSAVIASAVHLFRRASPSPSSTPPGRPDTAARTGPGR